MSYPTDLVDRVSAPFLRTGDMIRRPIEGPSEVLEAWKCKTALGDTIAVRMRFPSGKEFTEAYHVSDFVAVL